MQHKVDRVDWAILAAVQEDSSGSTAQLAERVGLSQAPCWRRLQKLKARGFIRREVALPDAEKLRWQLPLLVQVRLTEGPSQASTSTANRAPPVS